jgi:hypothetical protein
MATSIEALSTSDPSLAGRYLADQLSEEERLAFEERMITDPAVLREVEATARFKAGLARLRDSGELPAVLAPQRPRIGYFAAAAAIALFAIGITLLLPEGGTTDPWMTASIKALTDRHGAVLPIDRQYTLLRVRSEGGADAVIELPVVRRAIELRVLPDSGESGSTYRVTVSRVDGAAAGQGSAEVTGLVPDGEGYLALFVDSASLRAGSYRLVVEDEMASGDAAAAGTFLIDMRSAGAAP